MTHLFNRPWGWGNWGNIPGLNTTQNSTSETLREDSSRKSQNATSREGEKKTQSLLKYLPDGLSQPAPGFHTVNASEAQIVSQSEMIEPPAAFTIPAVLNQKMESYKLIESVLKKIQTSAAGLIDELENLEKIEHEKSLGLYIEPTEEARCLYNIETYKNEILENDVLKQFIFDSVKHALKDESLTLENLSTFLRENPLRIMKSVISSDGTPLVKKIGQIVEKKIDSIKAVTVLIDTLMTFAKTPDKNSLSESIKAISNNRHVKAIVTAMSLEIIPDKISDRSNPLSDIKKNPFILLHTPPQQSKCTLIKSIEKSMEDHSLDFDQDLTIHFVSREDNESLEVFNTRLIIYQLAQLNNALIRSNSKEQAYSSFKILPPHIQNHLSEIVWRLDQHATEDFIFGKHAIEDNPYILINIRNSARKNIVEQLIDVLEKKAIFMRAFEIFHSHYESPNKEALLRDLSELSAMTKEFPPLLEILRSFTGSEEELKEFILRTKEKFNEIVENCIVDNPINPEEICTNPQYKLAEMCQRVNSFKNGIKVAMIAVEYKGLAAVGGLAEALKGMTESLNGNSRPPTLRDANVIAILPKYSDGVIPRELSSQFQGNSVLYTLKGGQQVYTAYIGNVLCLFISDDRFQIPVGKSVYFSDERNNETHRFLQFQKLAAELSIRLFRDRIINVIHCHDSQTGLIPYIIKKTESSENLPACVFTTHNNLHQFCFEPVMLKKVGLQAIAMGQTLVNSFSLAFAHADACTTVSEQFAKEAMSTGVLGRGVHNSVISSAFRGKFFSILNGNSVTWNPKKDSVLANWSDITTIDQREASVQYEKLADAATDGITKDSDDETVKSWIQDQFQRINTASQENRPISYDLRYGPEDHPLVIIFKKQLCKIQIALYFKKYNLGSINPTKPLLLNIGRLDPYQKGIDKLPAAMEMVKKLDAQMVAIGLGGESCKTHMDAIQAVCDTYNKEGLILIQDQKGEGGKIKWQQGHTTEGGATIPGMGPILRAAADIGFFPSEYEPCGLVQGESFLFGTLVVATQTGGFVDTVFNERSDEHNGWLFDKNPEWEWLSEEQTQAMQAPIEMAVKYVKERALPLDPTSSFERTIEFGKQLQKIMQSALQMGWNETPDRSKRIPGAEKLLAVYQSAIQSKTALDQVSYFDYAQLEKKVEIL
ncbi:MAG: glycogen synthase [Chlamydiae bacterium]|nr:glycogen synthase [Chlamydiota bacterium]